VYLLKPNLRELNQLAGMEFEDDAQVETAAQKLIVAGYAEMIVVSLGAGGATVVTATEMHQLRAPTVPIRSKVGAGDTMVAGITLSLARGWSLLEAARYGVVAGSATVMTDGTQLCNYDDVERLYQQMVTESK
jgi:6-phosphofructokinase 2